MSVKHFNTRSVIGKGSYGKVLLVEKKDTGKMYALKILKKKEILRRNQFEHTMDERRILVSTPIEIPFVRLVASSRSRMPTRHQSNPHGWLSRRASLNDCSLTALVANHGPPAGCSHSA